MSTPSEDSSPSLDERKIAIEEKKLEIEVEKLKVERLKAWTTGGSIVISLLIAALTISFSVWSQHKQVITQFAIQDKQAKSQTELGERTAKAQFEIKAAEIVMNTESPLGAQTKARALANMFPDRLPNNFAASFDPNTYSMPVETNIRNHQPKGLLSGDQLRQMQGWRQILDNERSTKKR